MARRLKKGLSEIINETQTGFMADRHISCNISLVLDLIDYSDYVESDALILFLDFYKAFNTVEHQFLFQALKNLVLGKNSSLMLECFIKTSVVVSCFSRILLKDSLSIDRSGKAVRARHFSFL